MALEDFHLRLGFRPTGEVPADRAAAKVLADYRAAIEESDRASRA